MKEMQLSSSKKYENCTAYVIKCEDKNKTANTGSV